MLPMFPAHAHGHTRRSMDHAAKSAPCPSAPKDHLGGFPAEAKGSWQGAWGRGAGSQGAHLRGPTEAREHKEQCGSTGGASL